MYLPVTVFNLKLTQCKDRELNNVAGAGCVTCNAEQVTQMSTIFFMLETILPSQTVGTIEMYVFIFMVDSCVFVFTGGSGGRRENPVWQVNLFFLPRPDHEVLPATLELADLAKHGLGNLRMKHMGMKYLLLNCIMPRH